VILQPLVQQVPKKMIIGAIGKLYQDTDQIPAPIQLIKL